MVCAAANLAIMPHSLISFWVNIVRLHGDVGKLPLQAFGFYLLKGCFANKVSRLEQTEVSSVYSEDIQILMMDTFGNLIKRSYCILSCYLIQFNKIIQSSLQRVGVTVHL